MYVLDTNAFYYAVGISECTYDVEKLRELVRKNETFLSTTSLFEFLTKYQNDIETVKQGGRYLWQNHIRLASNVINPLPEHFTDDLVNITERQLQLMCTDVLENKIDVESRFTTLLFDVCLFSGYYFVVMSDGNEPCEYCYSAMTAAYRMFTEVVLDVFRELYRDGYKTDDCENYIRNGFYNLLAFMLEKGIPFIEKAKTVTSDDEFQNIDIWFPAEEYTRLSGNIASKLQTKTSTGYLQKLAVTYWKNNNDPELKKHIGKLKAIFDKKIGHQALQDYCYDTMVNILVHGAALWKNDLLDAIILCNLQDAHQLITYDNGVIKRMEQRKTEYKKYDESLAIIAQLRS